MNTLSSLIRPLVTACAVCTFMGGCASTGGTGGAAEKQSISSAFQAYKQAWNRHDVNALMGYFGSTGSLSSPGAGPDPVSGKALERWLGGLFTGIPDFRVEVVSLDVVGEHRVVDQWVISGTWTQPFPEGPLQGVKPTGKSFKVSGAGFYDWQNGHIARAVDYLDNMAFLVQIGVIPPPGSAPLATAK
jgi:predicted ester cyclase